MSKVYIVTKGSYSDYRICQVFADRATADAFREQLAAANCYADADVEEYELRESGFTLTHSAGKVTKVGRDGAATLVHEWSFTDEDGEYEDQVSSSVAGSGTFLDPYEVFTRGDARKVPQAHSDAVAKLRAEVMGL
ncbi:hypothetical protein ACFQ8W_00370 [Streptomyces sp. NPDC056508]|uniref:DUF7336 domain-containing protein n=1 Tax=Streptomyces sp. NPDC056508 TaxID=3345845 RepID=UPI00369B8D76